MDLFTFTASLSEHAREQVRIACLERNVTHPKLAVRPSAPEELCLVVTPQRHASLQDLLDLEEDLEAILAIPMTVVSANSVNGVLLAQAAVSL